MPEVSLLALKTPTVETAGELTELLATNPLPREMQADHVSERAKARMGRLLALNRAGALGEVERRELAKLIELEHLVISLKISLKAGLSAEDLSAA